MGDWLVEFPGFKVILYRENSSCFTAMEFSKTSALRFGTLLIQAAALLKLICLLISFLREKSWSIHKICASCKCYKEIQWWKMWKRQQGYGDGSGSDSSEQELNVIRCNWMHRFVSAGFLISMYRLVSRQFDEDRAAGYELNILVAASVTLLLTSFPSVLNPRSHDIAYVALTFLLDASHMIPPVEVDVRDVLTFGFAHRFSLAVLAQRTSVAAFGILLHLLQAILIVRLQGRQNTGAYSIQGLIFMFLLMFLGILAVRRLMKENVLLKENLQKRSVELGAVSSLLTPCYDAVVEVDQNFKLTQEPGLPCRF